MDKKTELKKNDVLTINITGLGYNGEGVSKDFEMPIFVPFALPGERVEVKIIFAKKDFYVGKLEKIIIKSNDRTEPLCPVFTKCGGCQLEHLCYEKQLEFKKEHVRDCFKKIAGMDVKINDAVPSKMYEYRNKFALPVGNDENGNVVIGMYAGNSHRIIDIDGCPITQKWNKDLIKTVKSFVKKYKISAYNEQSHKGLLKHVVARKVGKKLCITMVINSGDMPYKNELVNMLKKEFGEDICIYLNINKLNNNIILGEKFVLIYGNNPIDDFDGVKTPIHPNSFYQVNDDIKTLIYQKVLAEIDNTNVIDAYSGAGTISNYIAKNYKAENKNYKVYSVEIIPEAVEGAKKSSRENNVDDYVNHILGDCAVILPDLTNKLNASIIIDPPRKGLDKNVIDSIIKSNANKICYISCDPSTLARDVKFLSERYNILSVTPYDMFPNTKHIETLVIMERKI